MTHSYLADAHSVSIGCGADELLDPLIVAQAQRAATSRSARYEQRLLQRLRRLALR